jgi:acetylornithine/succinyldiaminopimelate/putrescine aminotransferase
VRAAILVIGKAIGGGLWVSVVVTSHAFEISCREGVGRHVQSYQNGPFSGGVAVAAMATLQDERLVEAAARGEQRLSGLGAIKVRIPAS